MARTAGRNGGAVRVELTASHPECWAIDVTEDTNVGLLGRGVHETGQDRANTHVTIFSGCNAIVEDAIEAADASPYTFAVEELARSAPESKPTVPGMASVDLLVEHNPRKQLSGAFLSRGFVYSEPVDVNDGIEYWKLLTRRDRSEIQSTLDEIREEKSAAIELVDVTSVSRQGMLAEWCLSPRQLEVFALARKRGYYRLPKDATAADLAGELGITTSTFHEHLHRAEEKLLDLS